MDKTRPHKIPRRFAFILLTGLVLWGVGLAAWSVSRPRHPICGTWEWFDGFIPSGSVVISSDGTFRKTGDGKVSTGTWKPVEAWTSDEQLIYEDPDTPNVVYIVPKYVSSEGVNSNPHLRKLWEQRKFRRCPEAYQFVTDGDRPVASRTEIVVPEDEYRELDSWLVDWNLKRQSPRPDWLTGWLAKVRRGVQI